VFRLRKLSIGETTFYNWKKKHDGLGAAELRRLSQMANGLLEGYRVSEHWACSVVMLSRTVFPYIEHKRDDRAVRQRIREIAETQVRSVSVGYKFCRVLKATRSTLNEHTAFIGEEGLNLRNNSLSGNLIPGRSGRK
jgi:hypothetical protein